MDPEPVFQGGDCGHHLFLVGSISWAEKALAAFKI